ncbi:hypothetical protein LSH36_2187g00002 [Paralvinella palmiformis]|uniref:Uncharacterized protein n=1 Tax=Paralvinella palmiformis TaxID=53620 RepID=A0AAD9MPI4_9ANNE|nr:hypothetical protein LSH36_2187g00002 [Paralvinella palmiformis]
MKVSSRILEGANVPCSNIDGTPACRFESVPEYTELLITPMALWQLLLTWLYTYLDGVGHTLTTEPSDVCTSIDTDHTAQMVDKLATDRFQRPMKEFAAALTLDDHKC